MDAVELAARDACKKAGFDPNEIVPKCNDFDMPGVYPDHQVGTGFIVGYKRPRWHFFLDGPAKAKSFV